MHLPAYAAKPKIWGASVSAANTNRDGSGTVVTLIAAQTSDGPGRKIERICAKARVTTTAGQIRFYLHDGTSYFNWKELAVEAVTASAATPAWEGEIDCSAPDKILYLPAGWSLRMVSHVAEAFDVTAIGGEF